MFVGNRSTGYDVADCEFASYVPQGSAIFSRGNTNIDQCVFIANSVFCPLSGPIQPQSGQLRLANSVLWYHEGHPVFGGASSVPATIAYSIADTAEPGDGNSTAMPAFVRWPDDGGDGGDGWYDTPDNNDYGDLRPLAGSSVIDAGSNDLVAMDVLDLDHDADTTEPVPFDADGNPRFVDDPATTDTGAGSAPIVDIGPYEFQSDTACAADLTGEGDVNTNDFFLYLSYYQAMDPRADFAPGGGINTNDFFAFLAAYQAGC